MTAILFDDGAVSVVAVCCDYDGIVVSGDGAATAAHRLSICKIGIMIQCAQYMMCNHYIAHCNNPNRIIDTIFMVCLCCVLDDACWLVVATGCLRGG